MTKPSGASRGDGEEVTSGTSHPTPKTAPTAHSEITSLQITAHKLNGRKFLQWSRSIQMVIRGKGKIGYLDGTLPKPSSDDPSYPLSRVGHPKLYGHGLVNSLHGREN